MMLRRTDKEVHFAERMGGRIFRERRRRGLTRLQVRERTGICEATIFRIEMGLSTASSFQLFSLAAALAVSVEELYPPCRVLAMDGTGEAAPMEARA